MCYDNFKESMMATEIDNEIKRFIMDIMLIDPYNFCTLCPNYKKCNKMHSPFVCAKKIYDNLIEFEDIPDDDFCNLAIFRAFITAIKSNRNDITIF